MADFDITVHADDNATGATGGAVEDTDYAHVRNFVKGQLVQLEGMLPLGWTLEMTVHEPTGSQTLFAGNPARPSLQVVVPVDRFDKIETGVCGSLLDDGSVCGQDIANQGDGVWYHLQRCSNPEPPIEE